MSAYVKQLNSLMAMDSPVKSTLQQRFKEWYGPLPEVARNRPFSMVEFERALGTQGKYISVVLLELGWQRKRRWTSRGQYHRYWLPPL
ncbi:hypothetical protein [Paraburkholderia gardini]|uniref:Uncharacterized protein n=1 Tax=Paraburkholderia gardini TaxID=2823469 RepID=A0ABM8U644_9BURK|nr:hypothetical protein [Paraburkholderia gardini]CAG4907457.1 hypothetical protein R54767_03408 [Paraburkholderia gardini]